MAVWVGLNEPYRMGGVDLLAEWPDYQDVPPGTYIIHRPLFPPLILSVDFYALLALSFGWCFCCEGRSSGPGRGMSSFEAGLLRRHG